MTNKNKISVKITHNNDAFEDPKTKRLYFKYGFEGYGLYWRMLMVLVKETEHKMASDFDFWSDYFGVEKEKIDFIVNECKLLKFTDDDQYIYSQSLLDRINIIKKMTSRYFYHDANLLLDDTLALRNKYGLSGFGVYLVLLEKLHSRKDKKLKYDTEYLLSILDVKVKDAEKVSAIIFDLIKEFRLLKLTRSNKIYSKYFRKIDEELSEKRRIAIQKRWSKQAYNTDTNAIQADYNTDTSAIQADYNIDTSAIQADYNTDAKKIQNIRNKLETDNLQIPENEAKCLLNLKIKKKRIKKEKKNLKENTHINMCVNRSVDMETGACLDAEHKEELARLAERGRKLLEKDKERAKRKIARSP